MASNINLNKAEKTFLAACDNFYQAASTTPLDYSQVNNAAQPIIKKTSDKHWKKIPAADLQSRVTLIQLLSPTDQKVQQVIDKVCTKLQDIIKTTTPPTPTTSSQDVNAKIQQLIALLDQLMKVTIANKDPNAIATTATQVENLVHYICRCTDTDLLEDVYKACAMIELFCDDEAKADTAPQSLKDVYHTISILAKNHAPTSPSSPTSPTSPTGINNSGGNDCFLIALCQMLEVPALRKYLVDQLPDELWNMMAANNLDSTAIRTALVNSTNFGSALTNAGLDPMTSQLDSSEVLAALFDAIDRKPNNKASSTPSQSFHNSPATQKSQPSFRTKIRNAVTTVVKTLLKPFVWVGSLLLKPFVWIYELWGDKNDDTADSKSNSNTTSSQNSQTPPQTPYTPNISPQRIVTREPYRSFKSNPLLFDITFNTERTSKQNKKKTSSIQTEPYGILPIGLPSNGPYEFNTLFTKHFLPEKIQDPTETLLRTCTFSKPPQYLTLSLKRFSYAEQADGSFDSKKITDDIEGIPLQMQLPQESLNATDKNNPNPPNYELLSFVTHLGGGANGGHYVAYRKEPNGWYLFNDGHKPEACSEDKIREAVKQSYLVYYQRKD